MKHINKISNNINNNKNATLGNIEDAKYLRTYLESPQVLEELIKEFNFKKEYKKKFPDF